MRQATILIVLAGLIGGCANTQQTPQQAAADSWNAARANVMLGLARDQYTSGDFEKARQTVNQALSMNPKDSNAHILSAKIAMEQGQLEYADGELNAARAITPNLPEADYLDGVLYQRWQQPAKSLIFYQHASEEAPTELSYMMAKAETLVTLNRQSEALALLQSKADYFEHNPVIHDEMGMILLQQQKVSDAVDMFRWAIMLSPDDTTIREHLSLALFQDKRYAESAANLQRLIKNDALSKRADLYLTLAECQLNLNRVPEARINAQTACNLDPSSTSAWLTVARLSMQLGDQMRAEGSINRALALEPSSSQAYLLLGYLRVRQNNFPAALDAFKQASTFDPTDTTSLCMAGYALNKMSRPREAAAYYQQALKVDPNDQMAHQFLAGTGGD